jgi:regulator of protease activity HflC (stomatin/prohibitin superfamily)
MISQLLTFLAQFWKQLIFWVVVDTGQVGILRKWGVPAGRLKPGLTWKLPVRDTVDIEDGREWTYILDPQSIRTIDGVQVVLRLSAMVRVVNPHLYFTRCGDGRNNIQDAACGELTDIVQGSTAEDVLSGRVLELVRPRVLKVARRWGMRVDSLKFHDCAESPSVRLWQSNFTSAGQD